MRVAHVAAEVAPWAATGGLADVASALPDALAREGVRCGVWLPLYSSVRRELKRRGLELREGPGPTRTLDLGGALQVFVESHHFDREDIYGDERGAFGDNDERFALLARVALDTAEELLGGPIDVFHAHDWHAALVPHYLRQRRTQHPRARSVFTLHNLAFQGRLGRDAIERLGLDPAGFHLDGYEWHGGVNLLKAGIADCDVLTTVSPRYAEEILSPAFGHGLDGFLRRHQHKLHGVLNGLDPSWDPRGDDALVRRYGPRLWPSGKRANRRALIEGTQLRVEPEHLLVGVISRLSEQKGLDLLADLVPRLHEMGVRVFLLGSGDRALERRFRQLARHHSHTLHAHIGFERGLARRILAGSDALAIPSRFEPCGLTQLQAMRYGCLPVVHATGGLADTVDHGRTGFVFEHADVDGLGWALGEAARMHRDRPGTWKEMARRAMAVEASWERSARAYLRLYSM